ncbi:MAG: right-handed parallel beta-helix repeat-containing protein [Pseudomonadota bacterium]
MPWTQWVVALFLVLAGPACGGGGIEDSGALDARDADAAPDAWGASCTPGETRCSADRTGVLACSKDGETWSPLETCPADAACVKGRCECGTCRMSVVGQCVAVGVRECPLGWVRSEQCTCEPAFPEDCADDEVALPDGACVHVGPDIGVPVLDCQRDEFGVPRCVPLVDLDCPSHFRPTLVGSCVPVGPDSPCGDGPFGDHEWPEETIYVDPASGDDTHSGLNSNVPVQSITAAMSRAQEGGTIALAAGTYDEGFSVIRSLHFRGKCAAETVIAGEYIDPYTQASNNVMIDSQTEVSFEDLTFSTHDAGLLVLDSNGIDIRNVRFVPHTEGGIALYLVGGSDLTVERCSFEPPSPGDGQEPVSYGGISVQNAPQNARILESEFRHLSTSVAVQGAEITIEGSHFTDIRAAAVWLYQNTSGEDGSAVLKESAIQRPLANGVGLAGGGHLAMHRCIVADPVPVDGPEILQVGAPTSMPEEVAFGVVVHKTETSGVPSLVIEDSLILGGVYSGVFAVQADMVIADSFVGGTAVSATDEGSFGHGVACLACPDWDIHGSVLSDNGGTSILLDHLAATDWEPADGLVRQVRQNLVAVEIDATEDWVAQGITILNATDAEITANLVAVDTNVGISLQGASATIDRNIILITRPSPLPVVEDGQLIYDANAGLVSALGSVVTFRDNYVVTNRGLGSGIGLMGLGGEIIALRNRFEERTPLAPEGLFFGISVMNDASLEAFDNSILALPYGSSGITGDALGRDLVIRNNTVVGGGDHWGSNGPSPLPGMGQGISVANGFADLGENLVSDFWGTGVFLGHASGIVRRNWVLRARGDEDPASGYSGDGIVVAIGSDTTLCENRVEASHRYGMLVKDSRGSLSGNSVFGNRFGLGLDLETSEDVSWQGLNAIAGNVDQDVYTGMDIVINTALLPFPDDEFEVLPPPECK